MQSQGMLDVTSDQLNSADQLNCQLLEHDHHGLTGNDQPESMYVLN